MCTTRHFLKVILVLLFTCVFCSAVSAQVDDYSYQEQYVLRLREKPVMLAARAKAVDEDENGLYDFLQITLDLEIVEFGHYFFKWSLLTLEGQEVTHYGVGRMFKPGVHKQDIYIASVAMSQSLLDGPYIVKVDLVKDYKEIIDRTTYRTRPYLAGDFE
ncbi:hypothetical protein ACFL1E_00985 [Candidatus Omnitrophota bacterium]